jgi:hypothetical protein
MTPAIERAWMAFFGELSQLRQVLLSYFIIFLALTKQKIHNPLSASGGIGAFDNCCTATFLIVNTFYRIST